MKKIFIDYDTTLVNFQEVLTQKINTIEGTYFSPLELSREGNLSDIKKKNRALYAEQNIYIDIVPFNGAIQFLNDVKLLGYNIILLTGNANKVQMNHKNNHIKKYFNDIFDDIIHVDKNIKHKYTKNSIFIDDCYDNVINHIKENQCMGIVFNYKEYYVNKEKLNWSIDKLYHITCFKELYLLIKNSDE